MREMLKFMEGERRTFIGAFERVGSKPGYNGMPKPTFLLVDVRDLQGRYVTDHLWFNQTNEFKKLGKLNIGDLIQFDGRCKEYGKAPKWGENGVVYTKFDYKISHPIKFKILRRGFPIYKNF